MTYAVAEEMVKARSAKQTEVAPDESGKITFHYLKSPAYRAVHSDGIFGGITPRGHLSIAFFSERITIPQRVEHFINDGVLGKEVPDTRVGKDGVLRQIECDVIMTIGAAEELSSWLQSKLRDYERISKELREKDNKKSKKKGKRERKRKDG